MEHKKQYMIIFDVWSSRTFSREITEFDTKSECQDYGRLINSIYVNSEPTFDRYGNEKSWGYVMLDFKNEKILGWGPTKRIHDVYKTTNILKLKDTFFRGEDEVPKDYKWKNGEYEGWLQYRWGDGKNAIDYKGK